MNCPLCNSTDSRGSWMGATVYGDNRYEYQQCAACGSMFVSPMPDDATLQRMYGADYSQFISTDGAHSGEAGTSEVLDELAQVEGGAFLDYGCGGGHLLKKAAGIGWTTYGVDFDRSSEKKSQGDSMIVENLSQLPSDILFDAVHLGDVIEHLTDPNRDMPEILKRLRRGGIVIAQGPLEANFNLFLFGLRLKKIIRNTPSSMPPYHVSLATSDGQKEFFTRFGLEEVRFDIFETAHPAPEKLPSLRDVRSTSLFLLRKISQTFSPILSSSSGNRYFNVGTKIG